VVEPLSLFYGECRWLKAAEIFDCIGGRGGGAYLQKLDNAFFSTRRALSMSSEAALALERVSNLSLSFISPRG